MAAMNPAVAVHLKTAVNSTAAAEGLSAAAVEGSTSEGGVVHAKQQQQHQYALHTHTVTALSVPE